MECGKDTHVGVDGVKDEGHLAGVSRANAGTLKGSLAVGEAVLKAPC